MANTLADAYFVKFTRPDAANVLLALPGSSEKCFEDDWLDFKSAIDGKTKQPLEDKKIQELWSKALGAMANAGGGVLVWGLLAEKDGNPPVDAVKSLALVNDVDAFASKLNEFRRFVTDPPLRNVKIKPIPKAEGEKEGFVVCLIPQGDMKPYQSLKAGLLYYLRAGDSSHPANRSILKQLFNPQYNPRLSVTVEPNYSSPNGIMVNQNGQPLPREAKWFEVRITNAGDSSLYNGFLKLESPTLRFFHWTRTPLGQLGISAALTVVPLPPHIHPGMDETLHLMAVPSEDTQQSQMDLTLYAEHMTPKKAHLTFVTGRRDVQTANFE